jgi:hypothetical protein
MQNLQMERIGFPWRFGDNSSSANDQIQLTLEAGPRLP